MTELERVLVFSRYPEPGQCKTRLIPALGATGAARLQQKMTEHVVGAARQLQQVRSVSISVYYSGGNRAAVRRWLGVQECYAQRGGDIGARMKDAFASAFELQAGLALLVGSDIPGIRSEHLEQAFDALHDHEVVLGPTFDGGYYLVGMIAERSAELLPLLFEDIAWSTPGVYRETAERLGDRGIRFARLPVLQDIDNPADLTLLEGRGWA
jgi:rSAM/selenodomain-associated transferase 1